MLTPPNRLHALLGGLHNTASSTPLRQAGYILPGEPPNILMVLTDDHGYTDIGPDIDSNVATPVLADLLRKGMHLTNGYATAAQCVPSRAGLMTGRNQNTFGLWKNGADAGFGPSTLPPRPNVTTIAEHLKELGGYVTGMAGKWHIGPDDNPSTNPRGRGFDWFFSGTNNQWWANMILGPAGGVVPVCANASQVVNSCHSGISHTSDKRNRIDVTAEVAEAFIQTHQAARWFFYWAPYGPHHPMLEDGDTYLESFRKVFKPYSWYTASENDARRRGLALVHAIDTRMGLILTKLRSHSLEEKTLILFSSDNGAPLGASWDSYNKLRRNVWRAPSAPLPSPRPEGSQDDLLWMRDSSASYVGSENLPLRGDKGTTWEGGCKVPMFIYWKGRIAPGQVMRQAVTTLDLTATIAQAAGMHELPAEHFDGVSLLPWLLGAPLPASNTIHAHLYWHGLLGDTAVQSGGWKLRRSDETFLFNITHDPLELYNLAESHASGGPKTVEALNEKLDQWLHALPFTAPCRDRMCESSDARYIRSMQPCVPSEVDPRFKPYSSYGKNAGQEMCWPARVYTVHDADASALSPNADGSGAALCDVCGHHNSAEPNCCSKGGSWEGFCDGSFAKHTWHDGFLACQSSQSNEARVRTG